MTPNRPYLLRALFGWILDNNTTLHLLGDAKADGVCVPSQYITDDKIVLNISPSAVRHLEMGNDVVTFSTRFGGSPIGTILAYQ